MCHSDRQRVRLESSQGRGGAGKPVGQRQRGWVLSQGTPGDVGVTPWDGGRGRGHFIGRGDSWRCCSPAEPPASRQEEGQHRTAWSMAAWPGPGQGLHSGQEGQSHTTRQLLPLHTPGRQDTPLESLASHESESQSWGAGSRTPMHHCSLLKPKHFQH